jgi:RHS repeat-associated protein
MTSIATTNYSYDGIGRLQDIEHKRSTKVFADYDFTYDSASRIIGINDSGDEAIYGYDSTGQLIEADYDDQANETYQYDTNGNRSNYVIGDNNQILSDGIYNYTYDAEGNRTSKTNIETGEITTYTWDNRNRLVTVTTADYTVNYRYDYLNRLVSRTVNQISKTINPITPQPPTPTQTVQHFIHDGNQIVLEFEDNELAQRNLWGAAVDELLAVDNLIDDETLWVLADHLNSTRHILKNDNGQVSNIASINYDAFGNIIDGENPINLGYTGKYFDNITNLQWNINRWYDATTGQWLSEDPIGFKGGDANLYRYNGNDVIDKIDPDGLLCDDGFDIFGGLMDLLDKKKRNAPGGKVMDELTNMNETLERLGNMTSDIVSIFNAMKSENLNSFFGKLDNSIISLFENLGHIKNDRFNESGFYANLDFKVGLNCQNLSVEYDAKNSKVSVKEKLSDSINLSFTYNIENYGGSFNLQNGNNNVYINWGNNDPIIGYKHQENDFVFYMQIDTSGNNYEVGVGIWFRFDLEKGFIGIMNIVNRTNHK